MSLYHPESAAEAADIVMQAVQDKTALRLTGGGTKSQIGKPFEAKATVSTTKMSGITLYEPSELVIGAKAGTPLAELVKTLDAQGQFLPFEPQDWRMFLDSSGEATVGGMAATRASGPRRIWGGSCRDSMIGVTFVNGRGEVIKSGGRVMKNVTGLDLVKLQGGAWGTLGLLTEVIFKVVPKPERVTTLVWNGLNDRRAIDLLNSALASPFEPTGAAHLPAEGKTVLRLEGFDFSIRYRTEALSKRLADYGQPDVIEDEESRSLWHDIRDIRSFAGSGLAVWRITCAPKDGPELVSAIASNRDIKVFYDWGGGLIWLVTAESGEAGASIIRSVTARFGGDAMLVRGSSRLRAEIAVFQPMATPLARLTEKMRASLDPHSLFNPGLMG